MPINHVNIQCGEAALTLLQLSFSLRSLQECECKEKLYSGFLPLSILRSVPELHHDDKGFSRGHTLGESRKDPAEKPQYLTEALNKHCSWGSLVLADDWFLFSNMDMQHIQHYAFCSVCLERLPSVISQNVLCLMNASWRVTTKLRLEAWELCIRISPPFSWMWTCGKHQKLLPSPPRTQLCSVLTAEMTGCLTLSTIFI